jgi:hypothetical protein
MSEASVAMEISQTFHFGISVSHILCQENAVIVKRKKNPKSEF